MLWSRRAAFGLVTVIPLLAACGFQPLHGKRDGGGSEALSAIYIAPIPDRPGQILHNELTSRINPGGRPRSPLYRLDVDLKVSRRDLGIRKDETATRSNLIFDANFIIRDAKTSKTLFQGRALNTNSYNILESRFATIASEADAVRRAARTLADNIRTRVSIYFSQQARKK